MLSIKTLKIPVLSPNKLFKVENIEAIFQEDEKAEKKELVVLYYGINNQEKENEIIDFLTEIKINHEVIPHPFLDELENYPDNKFHIPYDFMAETKFGFKNWTNYLECCIYTNGEATKETTLFSNIECTGYERIFIFYIIK